MPSARIRLEIDPVTGKRTVTIGYESDLDALPHEHEEAHRAVLEKLFEGGMIEEGDTIRVEREGTSAEAEATAKDHAQDQGTAREVKQGS
jgi:hypothetical protein